MNYSVRYDIFKVTKMCCCEIVTIDDALNKMLKFFLFFTLYITKYVLSYDITLMLNKCHHNKIEIWVI